jgi:hypothetical protein
MRTAADEVGISEAELVLLRQAKLSDATAFYVELRRALRAEFDDGKPFMLPATKLARENFLPERRDRKLYLRLTHELVRLGLIERVKAAGFAADGGRVGALFMFTARTTARSDNVVFLASRRVRG